MATLDPSTPDNTDLDDHDLLSRAAALTGLPAVARPRRSLGRLRPTRPPHRLIRDPRPRRRRPGRTGRGGVRPVRQPPRIGVPGLLGPLRRRRLPPALRRARGRRQGHPDHGRGQAAGVPHPHRTVVRAGPHPPHQYVGSSDPVRLPLLSPPRRPHARHAARRRRLRLRRGGAVAGACRAALAPLRHRPAPGAGGRARRPRPRLRHGGPAVLRQGRRIPAPRTGALPRRHPGRRPRRTRRPVPGRDQHRRPAGRRHRGGTDGAASPPPARTVPRSPSSGVRSWTCARSAPTRSRTRPGRSARPAWPGTSPSTPPRAPAPPKAPTARSATARTSPTSTCPRTTAG